MLAYKIHLIRHGEAQGSDEGQYIGSTDVSLSNYGKKQLKDILRECEYPQADIVISSPMNRCLETAKIIYPDKTPVILDGLTEYNFGEFEGKTADELKDDPDFKEWLMGGEEAGAPFGETNGEFRERVCKCFKSTVDGILKTENRSVSIITHGGVIMTIMQYFALPEAPMHEWIMDNGYGYTLNVDRKIWDNFMKLEAFSKLPVKYYENDPVEDDYDWDSEFDPSEFKGFYTPQED